VGKSGVLDHKSSTRLSLKRVNNKIDEKLLMFIRTARRTKRFNTTRILVQLVLDRP